MSNIIQLTHLIKNNEKEIETFWTEMLLAVRKILLGKISFIKIYKGTLISVEMQTKIEEKITNHVVRNI